MSAPPSAHPLPRGGTDFTGTATRLPFPAIATLDGSDTNFIPELHQYHKAVQFVRREVSGVPRQNADVAELLPEPALVTFPTGLHRGHELHESRIFSEWIEK